MKKELINAALYGGFRLGTLEHAWDLSSRCGIAYQELVEAFKPFVTVATDMVELGEGIAMSKPDDINSAVYWEFGDDYGRFIKDHGRLPKQEEAHAVLVNVVYNAFSPRMSQVQQESFRHKLEDMQGGDDD